MSEKNEGKRIRSLNYSPYEVELLLSEVGKRKSVLENKSKEQSTNNAKDKAWKEIADAFSTDPSCPNTRTAKKLTSKWQNLKKEARKAIGTYNREKRQTGGGSPPTEVPDVFRKIQELLPHEFNRINCPFDDDAISGPESPAIHEAPPASTPPMFVGSPAPPPIVEVAFNSGSPMPTELLVDTKPLINPISTPTMPPKKRPRPAASVEASELECMQKELLALRKENLEEEHRTKMRMLHAEHSLRMRALDWELKANMAHEQYWREGGPQRPFYTQPAQLALPSVSRFLQMDEPNL